MYLLELMRNAGEKLLLLPLPTPLTGVIVLCFILAANEGIDKQKRPSPASSVFFVASFTSHDQGNSLLLRSR